jgi:hypothetical protein
MPPNFLLFNDTCSGYKVFALAWPKVLSDLDLSQAKLWSAPSFLEEGPAPETRASASLPASGETSSALLAGLR